MDSPQADGEVMAESALLAQQLPEDPPDDGGGESWTAGLPEDIRSNESLRKFADFGALAKGYLEMDAYRGSSVALPGEGASGEDWAAFYGKVGWPETADGYRVPRNLPDGFEFTAKELSAARDVFHQAGLSDRQAQAMLYQVAVRATDVQAAAEKAHEEGMAKLRETWGDKFDAHTEVGRRAGIALGLPEDQARALEEAIGSSHLAWQALHAIGVKLGEDRLIHSDSSQLKTGTAEAQRRIDQVRGAFNLGEHSDHQSAIDEMYELYRIVHGDEEVVTTIAA